MIAQTIKRERISLEKILNFDSTSYRIRESLVVGKGNQRFPFDRLDRSVHLIDRFRGCLGLFWTQLEFGEKVTRDLELSFQQDGRARVRLTFVGVDVIVFGCNFNTAGDGFLHREKPNPIFSRSRERKRTSDWLG